MPSSRELHDSIGTEDDSRNPSVGWLKGRRPWTLVTVVLLVVGGAFAFVSFDYYSGVPEEAMASATYVGRYTCAQCHQDQVDAFHGSHHDRAMDVATSSTVLGDFSGVTLEHHGITSRMFRDGDRYMIHTEGPDGEMTDFHIKYVFGFDPLQQYMVELEPSGEDDDFELGRVQVLRVSWDTHREHWFYLDPSDVDEKLAPDDPLHWTQEGQNWNHMCADCHSTNVHKNFDVASAQYHTTFSEIDVSCESCHGPGSLHVELAESTSLFWDRNVGYGLADLKSADSEVEIQTCAHCHARRRMVHPNYRAGTPYFDHFTTELMGPATYHADGQIRDEVYVHGSFLQSRMYHEGIRCTDCHDPHTVELKHEGNAVCTSCHQHPAGKYDTPSHHHHQPGSEGASCVECHMPETTYMEVDPRRDHSLRVPRPDLSVDLGTPNACTRCHLEEDLIAPEKLESLTQYADWLVARSEGDDQIEAELARLDRWAADHCAQWYGEPEDRESHFAYAFSLAFDEEVAAAELLAPIVRDQKQSAMVRGSALMLLNRYPTQLNTRIFSVEELPENDPAAVAIVALGDPHPLVRTAALNKLEILPISILVKYAAPMMEDQSRVVRHEAARVLARVGAGAVDMSVITRRNALLDEYRLTLMDNGDQAGAHLALGMLEETMAQGVPASRRITHYARAMEAYETAVRLEPMSAGPHSALAALFEQLADHARQRSDMQTANEFHQQAMQARIEELQWLERDVQLAPENDTVQYQYALALQRAGRGAEAEQALLKAAEIKPNRLGYLYTLVNYYQGTEQWEKGLPWVEVIAELLPEEPEVSVLLHRFREGIRGGSSRN